MACRIFWGMNRRIERSEQTLLGKSVRRTANHFLVMSSDVLETELTCKVVDTALLCHKPQALPGLLEFPNQPDTSRKAEEITLRKYPPSGPAR